MNLHCLLNVNGFYILGSYMGPAIYRSWIFPLWPQA